MLDKRVILLNLWYRFLKLNETYKGYCFAYSSDDTNKLSEYKSKFPELTIVFDMWGDIFLSNTDFSKWYFRNKNNINLAHNVEYKSGKLTITLPEKLTAEQTKSAAKLSIDNYYQLRLIKDSYRNDEIRKLIKCLLVFEIDSLKKNKVIKGKLTDVDIASFLNSCKGLDFTGMDDILFTVVGLYEDATRKIRRYRADASLIQNNILLGQFPKATK